MLHLAIGGHGLIFIFVLGTAVKQKTILNYTSNLWKKLRFQMKIALTHTVQNFLFVTGITLPF